MFTYQKLLNASKERILDLYEKKFGERLTGHAVGRARAFLIRKYGREGIDPCPICGKYGKLPYVSTNKARRHQECGLGIFCDHHTKAEKVACTNQARYGVASTFQVAEVRAKRKATMVKRYGAEHALQSKKLMKKSQRTCQANYGVSNPGQSKRVQRRMRVTNLERYGVENAGQSKVVQSKMKATCRERYGVDFAHQSAEVIERQMASRYGRKEYETTDGRVLELQGYEPQVAEALESLGYKVRKCGKTIPYRWNGKRRYLPDFKVFHPKQGKVVIEVKSTHTLLAEGCFDRNLAKFKAADAKYEFRLAVYHKDQIWFIKSPHQFNKKQFRQMFKNKLEHPDARRLTCR